MTTEQYVIEAQSLDWIVLLDKMIMRFRKDEKDMMEHVKCVELTQSGGKFHVDKSWLPAEILAKCVGATPEAVLRAPVIVLKPFRTAEWQQPTVGYFGNA